MIKCYKCIVFRQEFNKVCKSQGNRKWNSYLGFKGLREERRWRDTWTESERWVGVCQVKNRGHLNIVATSYMWLSNWNVASVTEELSC